MITLPPEIEQLARRVAARSGRTPEDVLKGGVEIEAHIAGVAIAEGTKPRRKVDVQRVHDIVRRIASRPILDKRLPREILDKAWGERG